MAKPSEHRSTSFVAFGRRYDLWIGTILLELLLEISQHLRSLASHHRAGQQLIHGLAGAD